MKSSELKMCRAQRFYQEVIQTLTEKKKFPAPIVTEIAPAPIFYPAEDYHQNYYVENPNQPYCSIVIQSKLEKIKHVSFKKKYT